MIVNRMLRRLFKEKRIQNIRAEAEKKVGRPLSDEEFADGFYLALQQAERRKKNVRL